jgi:hypothetical protein
MLVGPINSGAAVGGNGVATATGESTKKLTGVIYAVVVKYNDSPPGATTVATIKTKGTSPSAPTHNILVLTNTATDVMKFPRMDACTTAGVANSTNDLPVPIDDIAQVVIAGANAGDNVDVWLYLI